MGKAEATIVCQVPSEQLPLLCQSSPSTTYLSQEDVVKQARAAPWQGLRMALLCLVGAVLACMLATALALLLMMPRPAPPLSWWQKASFYRLPPISFPDSDGDQHGDLEGVRRLLDQLVELRIQALVLGPILEGDGANLSRICPAHGSLEQLWALLTDGHKQGIQILLELPTWTEQLDLVAEDNRTGLHLKGALQFWMAQGVNGFLVAKDPSWHLEAILDAWSELGRQRGTDQDPESVLMIWDQSESCNISHWVPNRVILTCSLPESKTNLTASALTRWVKVVLQNPGRPWPGWTVAGKLPLSADLGAILGVLLFSLPGTPLLQGGPGSPVPLDNTMLLVNVQLPLSLPASWGHSWTYLCKTQGCHLTPTQHPGRKPGTNGHPLTALYHSLLPLRANSFALQSGSFTPLPFTEDIFAFLRPSICSGILVVLNLGSQPCGLNLSQPSFPNHAKVLFSNCPEPQSEVKMEAVQLAPHQGLLLRVHSR